MAESAKNLLAGEGSDADVEDVEETEFTKKSTLASEMMKDPKVLAALQSKLGSMVGNPSGYIDSLPACVKRRIKALKKLQVECSKIEAKFHEEVHALECMYANLYQPLFEKRQQIVGGKVEPTDEECDFALDSDKEEDDISEGIKKAAINEKGDEKKNDENVPGIPEFWLTTLKSVDLLADMIQEHDEDILKHLVDIKVKYLDKNPAGFVLEFHFEPNEYFTNTVLTKSYEIKCDVDEADPFSYEGPDIVGCKGCTIDWKKGKNVTVKTIRKKQKHKSRGSVRTVTKTVQNESFFLFFNPPNAGGDGTELDGDTEALLAADFEIGHFLKDRVIPRAVLYFTGEAVQDDEFDEDEDEEEEDDDDEHNEDDDEDEENDPDFVPKVI
ncbi:nucleosome assembly protein 1-like 1-B isoform X2 [Ornithodoros turicata]|uniref:nucleosome assembly protein 1-like 1-B isoform X2 n=1 Tax=Ornithodoros turicata TaxID=34597 RepID=UPI003139138F